MQKDIIKVILFDSGKVLNAPATGHWFMSPNFLKCALLLYLKIFRSHTNYLGSD